MAIVIFTKQRITTFTSRKTTNGPKRKRFYFKTPKQRINETAKLQNTELQLSHREKQRMDLKENDYILETTKQRNYKTAKQQNSEITKQRIATFTSRKTANGPKRK